jgi:hypothetical protein
MRADEANADLDETILILTALGGPSHGPVKGFGSVLQQKKQQPPEKGRATQHLQYPG